jgi:hypothetical protein
MCAATFAFRRTLAVAASGALAALAALAALMALAALAALMSAGCQSPSSRFLGTDTPLAGGAEDVADLRWRWRAGDVFEWVIEETHLGRLELPSGTVERSRKLRVETTWKVEAIRPDGLAEIAQRIERIEVDDRDPLLAQALERCVGVELRFVFFLGDVSQGPLPKEWYRAAAEPEFSALPWLFTDDGWAQAIGYLAAGAGKLQRRGESWLGIEKRELSFGRVRVSVGFTYAGLVERDGRRLGRVDVKKHLTPEPSEDRTLSLRLEHGEAEGRLYFDPEAGLPVEYRQEGKLALVAVAGAARRRQNSVSTVLVTLRPSGGR